MASSYKNVAARPGLARDLLCQPDWGRAASFDKKWPAWLPAGEARLPCRSTLYSDVGIARPRESGLGDASFDIKQAIVANFGLWPSFINF